MNERDIFIAALEIESPSDRQAFLEQACGSDTSLRERVEALLAAHQKGNSFLESPPVVAPDGTVDQPITEAPGTVIGPYKLLQQIGEGGMGVVYMAEQKEPVERRVALKIIKPGMDTRQVIARFEAERHALAMMDHPNIARVLDAGTTEEGARDCGLGTRDEGLGAGHEGRGAAEGQQRATSPAPSPQPPVRSSLSSTPCPLCPVGRPYFVMELVKGVPITQYCDEHHLTPQQRLELFVPVCHAIQHAHQKGIIHRDIKPTNVLVAEYDDRPVPKIIDFGVAKAIQQPLTQRTVFTQLGQVVGTIDYMSPEQAKLNELDVDTRSDVYSLGVLLYELLTGETPFDRERLHTLAFDELLRIIREEEPPKPSLRLSSSESLPSIAANRQIEPKRLSTLVRGELDWIVMKALEKDRSRRYETANALAADVQHYLADEPVVACPPSAAYRFRKFARRNKAPLTTLAIVGVVLLLAAVMSTWQAVRATWAFQSEMAARHEAELAEQEADDARKQAEKDRDRALEAEAVAQQQRDRAQAAERMAEANFAKARAAVDEYLTRVTESELLSVPGLQPLRRDLLAAARKYYEDFVLERGDQRDLQLELAAAHYRVGVIQRELGESEAAGQFNARAIELLEAMRQGGEDTPALKTQLAKAFFCAGRYNETVPLCQELLATDPENVEVNSLLGNAYNWLANAECDAGRVDAALEWHQQAFTVREELARRFPDDPKHLSQLGGTLNNLGVLLARQGRLREASQMYLKAADYGRRAYDLEPSSIQLGRTLAIPLGNAANMQARLGLDEEALATYERVQEVRRKLVWENPAVASLRGELCQASQALGKHQQKLGRAAEAQGSFREARDVLENIPRDTPEQMFELAAVYARLAQPPESPTEVSSDQDLAESQRNADLALQTLRKAVDAGFRNVETLKTWRDLDPLRERNDFRQLVATLEQTVQDENAAKRSSGTEPLDELLDEQPEDLQHQQTLATSLHAIGVIQAALKQYEEAERSFQRALELRDALRTQQPDQAQAALDLAEVRFALGQLYWDANRRPDAHRLWQEAFPELHKVAVENPGDSALQERVASCERTICFQYGAMGLWDLAATAARHNAALGRVTNYTPDADSAVLLAATGEQDAWREYCRHLMPQREEKGPGDAPKAPQIRTILLLAPPVIDAHECVVLARKVLERDPRRYYHHFCLALAQYRASQYGEALKTIESSPVNASWESISEEGNKPACAYLYALAADGDGRKDEAMAQLERAEALYQSTCKSQLAVNRKELTEPLCWWFWDLGTAQVLRREAWQKIKGQEPPPEAWWHLVQARGYGLLGESERADQELAAAVDAAPDDPEIWLSRARLLHQLGDTARAEADCTKALDLNREDPRPWMKRALLYAQQGEHAKANTDLARAASLEPKPGTAIDLAEDRFALGRLYWDSDRRPDAHRLWQEALRELHEVAVEKPKDGSLQQRVLVCTREICRHAATEALANLEQRDGWGLLFDGNTPNGWAVTKGKGSGGPPRVADGAIVLERNNGYTGIGSTRIVPLIDYEIAYEAWPDGPGEFASLIFPCGERYGRWYVAASETSLGKGGDSLGALTRREVAFPAGQWYALRLRVTSAWIEAWSNDQELFRVKTQDMRDTWKSWLSGGSTGFLLLARGPEVRVRNIRIRHVQPDAGQPQGAKEAAEKELAAAVATDAPDRWLTWVARARLLEQLGDAALAAAWNRALELAPADLGDDPLPWTERASLYAHLGRYDEAARDFIRANELLASNSGWDARSPLFESLIEHEEVFARIAELRPDDLALWGQRGHYHALRGQWEQALPAYARASAGRRPNTQYAHMLLLTGDEEGYRGVCGREAAQFGQTHGPDTARHLVLICSAGPQSGIDPARMVEWAELSVRSGRNKFTLQGLAWAHYRAGQFDQTVRVLQEAMDLPEPMPRNTAAFPLALAYRGLGQEEEARKWYQTGLAELQKLTPRDPDGPAWAECSHWVRVNVWYREAKTVFESSEPQAPKTEEPE